MTVSKVPVSIQIKRGSRSLVLAYADGEVLSLPFEYLRVQSPSAEVQGHGGGEGHLVPGKALVMLTGAEAVGNYALKLTFDDGHDSGLFSWDYFRTLGREYDARWARYLQRLDEAGEARGSNQGADQEADQGPGQAALKPQIWNG